jgi:HAD superfamily hydrolase (TIGR01509 family)
MPQSPWDAIILDLGNVVFEWPTESGVQPEATLKSMMRSDTYAQYETGQIETEDEFCSMLGEQLGLDSSLVRTTFETARQSLVANDELVDFIRELKRVTDIRVYAMSNIPRKEVDYLSRKHPNTMSIFDRIYASGKAGLRKLDLAFYSMVLSDCRLAPERAIFVDDKMQNVQAARDLGMRGLQFESTKALCDSLAGSLDVE